MKDLLITNVVYGKEYADVFLNFHLKAMLDETNLPAAADRIEYAVFTDAETAPILQDHPNFIKLSNTVRTHIMLFTWPEGADRFGERYSILVGTFRMSVNRALELDSYLSALVADLVPAKGFIPKILKKVDEGYDSVFVMPPRSALEAMAPELNRRDDAIFPLELFDLCYRNMHPLWVACNWLSPQFTKLPYSLVWNLQGGLLVRSFATTPVIFTPNQEMMTIRQVIDVELPSMCSNPFWATDWTDAPIIGVEHLQCYYPPFLNAPANTEAVREWALKTLHPSQMAFLEKKLYYPNKESVQAEGFSDSHSDSVVKAICGSP